MPLLAFLVVALELVEALLSLEILRRTGRGKDFVAGYLDGSVCFEIGTPVSWIYVRFPGGVTSITMYNDIPLYLEHLFDSRSVLSN